MERMQFRDGAWVVIALMVGTPIGWLLFPEYREVMEVFAVLGYVFGLIFFVAIALGVGGIKTYEAMTRKSIEERGGRGGMGVVPIAGMVVSLGVALVSLHLVYYRHDPGGWIGVGSGLIMALIILLLFRGPGRKPPQGLF